MKTMEYITVVFCVIQVIPESQQSGLAIQIYNFSNPVRKELDYPFLISLLADLFGEDVDKETVNEVYLSFEVPVTKDFRGVLPWKYRRIESIPCFVALISMTKEEFKSLVSTDKE